MDVIKIQGMRRPQLAELQLRSPAFFMSIRERLIANVILNEVQWKEMSISPKVIRI